MSTIIAFKLDQADGTDQLMAMLTSPDKHVRCLGRAFAAGIGTKLEEWLRAEQQRGTDTITLFEVVANLSVQHVASVAASALQASGDELATSLLLEIVRAKLPEYIASIRAHREGGER